jgi:hypothetical protein
MSPNRRGIQVVFDGLSGAFLLTGAAAMIGNLSDIEDRSILMQHEWSNRAFREMISLFLFVLLLGALFFWGAILVKSAGISRLSVIAGVNALLFAGSISGAKEIILAFPLGLGLAGLMAEIYRLANRQAKKIA